MEIGEIEGTLRTVGFSPTETKIYITLLKLGCSKAGEISKKSELNRTTTYDALKRLLQDGLVTYNIRGNRKWFEVVNPQRLIEILREKEEDLKKVLPSLQIINKKPDDKHNVTLYYGYKGIKTVFEDIIREAKVVCVMDSEGQLLDRMPHYGTYYVKQLDKKKVVVKYLIRKERHHSRASKSTEVRFVNKKTKSDAVINIYNNKIAIFVWTDPPEAVLIENQAAAESLRDYFYLIWEISKKCDPAKTSGAHSVD